jgi:hypothetical protein
MNVLLAADTTMSDVPSLFKSPVSACEPMPERFEMSSGTNSAPPGACLLRTTL